jgi:glycine cleavage system H protein
MSTNIPAELKYTDEHEWIKIEGKTVTIGITDFAQSSLGDIVFVELPDEGSEFDKGAAFGVVESIKSVSDLYSPIAGKVLAKNETVEDSSESINEDPYGCWLIKLEVANPADLETLLSAESYTRICSDNG